MRIPTVAERQSAVRPRRYDPAHVAWYFGGIVAALAATGAVAEVSPSGRGAWRLLLALAFIALFGVLAAYLLSRGWWVPAGVLATAAVVLVPVAGQAFERLIGVWPDDDEPTQLTSPSLVESDPFVPFVPSPDVDVSSFEPAFFALAVATILAGLAVFSIVRFPFAFVTVTVATLVAAQLLLPVLADDPDADDRMATMLVTGGMVFLVGLVLDSVQRRDDAFWWHTVGLFAIAIGLVWYAGPRGDGWAWIAILVVGGTLLLLSAPFTRAVWATFGVLGVFAVVFKYAGDWLGGWREPGAIALAAVALVGLGIALQLYERVWERVTRRPPPAAPPPPPAPEAEPPPAPPAAEQPPPAAEPPPPAEAPPPDEAAPADEAPPPDEPQPPADPERPA